MLCRTTALFVGGGGDQRKPNSTIGEVRIRREEEDTKKSKRGSDIKYPRVKELFELPIDERWKLAKTFSQNEMAYARRIQKRMMNEDNLIDELYTWELTDPSQESSNEMIGESDDGSI